MTNLFKLTLMFLLLFVGSNFAMRIGSVPTPQTTRDLGTEVLRIFSAKCASCHGPDLKHPEGRFGYVLDLAKIRNNPEFVIPGNPNESELWLLVKDGEMPPKDGSDSKLSEAEKSIIRDWITAGAPDSTSE